MNKYFLGIRKEDNKRVYLTRESWDCGWYWDFGNVEINCSLEHFDDLFLKKDTFDSFKNYFLKINSKLTNDKIWQLLGYMKEFYVAKTI